MGFHQSTTQDFCSSRLSFSTDTSQNSSWNFLKIFPEFWMRFLLGSLSEVHPRFLQKFSVGFLLEIAGMSSAVPGLSSRHFRGVCPRVSPRISTRAMLWFFLEFLSKISWDSSWVAVSGFSSGNFYGISSPEVLTELYSDFSFSFSRSSWDFFWNMFSILCNDPRGVSTRVLPKISAVVLLFSLRFSQSFCREI